MSLPLPGNTLWGETKEERWEASLNELSLHCMLAAQKRGFHEPRVHGDETTERDTSPGERIALIHSEVSEMLEAYRNSGRPDQFYIEVDGKPEGAAVELADVMIRCFDYAGKYGINLGAVLLHKLAYNELREYRHGGKVI